jgi:hypothetical protein
MAASDTIARIIDKQWPFIEQYCNTFQLRIFDAIRRCRTPALGGHLYRCDSCKKLHYRYNSCRNRHCSRCQNTQKEQWIEQREQQFINTHYYHLVFTIPHQLNELGLAYPRQLYNLLMTTAWQTIDAFGWNHKFIGAQTGTTMVLHTWGSNLSFHPHVHCIVPGGGVTISGKWKNAKGNGKFLFPVKGLSKKFKGLFITQLKAFFNIQGLDDTPELLQKVNALKWVVYAKPPFGGKEGVVRYLARYTHNVAISHHRIIDYSQGRVTFSYKDYRHAAQKKEMTITAQEFVRRLSMHFLPKGFCRIRHYGILSSAWKQRIFPDAPTPVKINWQDFWKNRGLDVGQCPNCKKGRLICIGKIEPVRGPPYFKTITPLTR